MPATKNYKSNRRNRVTVLSRFKNHKRTFSNRNKGLIDLFENLIGGGPPPAPNVVDQKYTYKVQNKNEYVQMVSKINRSLYQLKVYLSLDSAPKTRLIKCDYKI